MEDDGLTTSYGIFGAPRSGKTHLLLLLLQQLFDLKTRQPDKRFGGLILDPKAALIDDLRKVSLARQNGCLGLVVTQSVNVLEATSLEKHWKSIFSNFGAKIFMRLADNETAEEATKLIGDKDWQLTSFGSSQGGGDVSASSNTDLRERKFPSSVFTQLIERRHAAIVGSLDGMESQPGTWFVEIPEKVPPKSEWKKDKNKGTDDA
jgi:TraM recognition site of TraD and TraG